MILEYCSEADLGGKPVDGNNKSAVATSKPAVKKVARPTKKPVEVECLLVSSDGSDSDGSTKIKKTVPNKKEEKHSRESSPFLLTTESTSEAKTQPVKFSDDSDDDGFVGIEFGGPGHLISGGFLDFGLRVVPPCGPLAHLFLEREQALLHTLAAFHHEADLGL